MNGRKERGWAVATWLFFRLLRWALLIASAAYYIEYTVHRSDHVNSFGQLLNSTEFWMFGLPIAAMTAGLLELAAREKTGRPRPAFGRNWLG